MAERAKTLTSPLTLQSPPGACHWQNPLEATGKRVYVMQSVEAQSRMGKAENGSGGVNTVYPAASLSQCLEGVHPGKQFDQYNNTYISLMCVALLLHL